MRKVYLLLMLLLCSFTISRAQTVITSLDQLSNNKCYTIRAYDEKRGGWYSNDTDANITYGGVCLYSTGYLGMTIDDSSIYQQFAILQTKNAMYFYSLGTKQFLHAEGDYYVYMDDKPYSSKNQLISASASKIAAGYPFVAADGDYQFNMSKDQGTGVLSNWNDIDDGGNAVCITEVGDFDPTTAMAAITHFEDSLSLCSVTANYYVVVGADTLTTITYNGNISKNSVYTFNTPTTYMGMDLLSKNLDVDAIITCDTVFNTVWEYEYNYNALPIVPTSINPEDSTFAEDTKWYYINMRANNTYMYAEADTANVYRNYLQTADAAPANYNSFYCFVGNPIAGYKIYNYKTGSKISLCNTVSDASTTFLKEAGSNYMLDYDEDSQSYRIRLADTEYGCLNDHYTPKVTLYNYYDYGYTDKGSYIYFQEVPESDMEIAESGSVLKTLNVSPASGSTLKGNLSEISVYFDANIASTDASKITVTNADGDEVSKATLAVAADSLSQLNITFEPALEPEGTYSVNIPAGIISGPDDQVNQAMTLTYTLKPEFEAFEVYGHIHNWDPFIGDQNHPVWSLLTFPGKEEFEYLTCKVQVLGKDEINIIGWTGFMTDTLNVTFDSDTETVKTINHQEPDSYNSAYAYMPFGDYDETYDETYYYTYFYFSKCRVTSDYDGTGHGRAILGTYCYNANQYQYIMIDWMDDNSFFPTYTVAGHVNKGGFEGTATDDYSRLPYKDGCNYLPCKVTVLSENTIGINGWTGVAGDSITIEFDPSTGKVTKFDNTEGDAQYGSVWVTSSIEDYGYYGSYVYPDYSTVTLDDEGGQIIINLQNYTDYVYQNVYIDFKKDNSYDESSEDGIQNVKAARTDGNVYNLSGMKVNNQNLKPGLYIRDGRKVIVR